MMAPVAQLVMEFAVFQKHPAHDAGLDEDLEGPVYGGPAQAGQLPVQPLGGEMAFLPGHRLDDRPPRDRRPVAPLSEGFQYLLG